MKTATINDVAERAGVSKATVSYVLGGRETDIRVSKDTREMVLRASEELCYRPSETALALSALKREPLRLLLISPWLYARHSDFMTQVYLALNEIRRCIPMSVTVDPYENGNICKTLRPVYCRRFDAILVIGSNASDEAALSRRLQEYEDKEILLNRSSESGLCCVSGNDYEVMKELASRVTEVEGAVLLSEGTDSVCRSQRVSALREVFGSDMPTVNWPEMGNRPEEMLSLAKKYPRCCFCFTMIHSAARMLTVIKNAGFSLPGDVSLIGYDIHTLLQEYLPQPITTVNPHVEQMMEKAVALALSRRNGQDTGEKISIIPGEIVAGSTARLTDIL